MSDEPKAAKAAVAIPHSVNKARADLVEPPEEHEVAAAANAHGGGPK
jgi:hypothetical protein